MNKLFELFSEYKSKVYKIIGENLANQYDCCLLQKGQIQGAQGDDNVSILVFLTNSDLILVTIVH